jgi:3-phosphoglycerate kinase/nucleotide-binding universal stress UspA family protein
MSPNRLVPGLRTIPPKELRTQRVLVRIDPHDELELRESLPTLAFLTSAGARVTVVTEEPERAIACEIFCNEAFSLSHEVRTSTTAVAKKARIAVAGLAFERQLSQLETVLAEPERPVIAVLGGELSRKKLLLAAEVARRSDRLFIGGELCIPFLLSRGVRYTSPVVTDEMISLAAKILEEAREEKRFVVTPADFAVLNEEDFRRYSRNEPLVFGPPLRHVRENEIRSGDIICDIGPVTQWSWGDNFGIARTIFWHAPLGITEIDVFSRGTRFLAAALADDTDALHRGIVCGRTLIASIRRSRVSEKITRHLTPAGRAALHYFAGQPLPAVEVLYEKSEGRRDPHRILIPLDGSDSDANLIETAARVVTENAQVFLLHVRQGPDEEQYPDFVAAMSEAEKYQRRVESERIFARANAMLAAHGLVSSAQSTAQGKPPEIISRHAKRLGAEVIVERGPLAVLLTAENRGERHGKADHQSAGR